MLPTYDSVDLFAGPGGWDVAATRLGLHVLGIENDDAACATRAAAGHPTLNADIAALDPRDHPTRGQIASPPCQGFSMAGKGQARADAERLLKLLSECRTRTHVESLIADCHDWKGHEGTALVLEPLRWALATTPAWIAWEQVPTVLPIWQACAVILRRIGYTVATGYVQAEQYGVPQTRKRAVLLARAPWMTADLGPVALPPPTHSRYHPRKPDRIDPGMPRWVSMAEALGWDDPATLRSNYGTGGDPANRGIRTGDQPAPTVTSKADRNKWIGPGGVDPARPATTVAGDPRLTGRHHHDPGEQGRDAVPSDEVREVWENRPATTIVASFRPDIVAGPGYRKAGDGPRQNARGSVRVTVQEAAALQSFPADYPWQGTKGKQFQQVGNAVPPLLAEALLAEVIGVPFFPPSPEVCR